MSQLSITFLISLINPCEPNHMTMGVQLLIVHTHPTFAALLDAIRSFLHAWSATPAGQAASQDVADDFNWGDFTEYAIELGPQIPGIISITPLLSPYDKVCVNHDELLLA